MTPRTGRPKAEKPKNIRYSICLDEDIEKRLQKYCSLFGITKGEAIRNAIVMLLSSYEK